MAKFIVLLSGPVASGKSTLANLLQSTFGFHLFKTWELLHNIDPKVAMDRKSLQLFGERLDKATDGRWLVEQLGETLRSLPHECMVVIDAVRIKKQIDHIRRGFGKIVKHIHCTAPVDELTRRYKKRGRHNLKEFATYREVMRNKTEQEVSSLAEYADVVIDTARNTENDVLVRSACHLGLYGRGYSRVVDVIIGGQYGSEGKGQIAAHISSEYDVLVRVGGPNAGHKVYEEPRPYTYHSLPSGSKDCNAKVVLGAGAVVNPIKIFKEINECGMTPERLTIDPQVVLITEDDMKREDELVKSIGSTGQGVGIATARRILDRGVKDVLMAADSDALKPFVRPARDVIEDACRHNRRVLLEGTQGTGLSLFHGAYPHVTSRDTTVAGCLAEAGISPRSLSEYGDRLVYG